MPKMTVSEFFATFPIKQTPFAKRIGVNPSLIRQYTSGKKSPSVARLKQMTEAINKTGRELMSVKLHH